MSPDEAMERINTILAHLWMVRTFLKHADELQEDEELLEVHRMIFDFIRALEPSYQRKDAVDYLRRAQGKLSKLRRVEELFAREFRRVSDHTNFHMAAASLTGCVREIERLLSASAPSPRTPLPQGARGEKELSAAAPTPGPGTSPLTAGPAPPARSSELDPPPMPSADSP